MKTWNEYKAEQLQNPEVKKEYDALALEFALISARQEAGMSQQKAQSTCWRNPS